MRASLLCALLIWVPAIGSAQNPDAYSVEKEKALGRHLAADIERQVTLLPDPVVTGYVQDLAHRLARYANLPYPLTVKVIDDSNEARSSALPGGFLFVNSGMILRTGSEAELAAILAHQIAHIAARHGLRNVSRSTLSNGASIPLIFMGGWGGVCTRGSAGSARLVPAAFRERAQEFEQEADLLAAGYLRDAGYDPDALAAIFAKLAPDANVPVSAVPEGVVSTSTFERVKSRIHPQPARRMPPTLRREN